METSEFSWLSQLLKSLEEADIYLRLSFVGLIVLFVLCCFICCAWSRYGSVIASVFNQSEYSRYLHVIWRHTHTKSTVKLLFNATWCIIIIINFCKNIFHSGQIRSFAVLILHYSAQHMHTEKAVANEDDLRSPGSQLGPVGNEWTMARSSSDYISWWANTKTTETTLLLRVYLAIPVPCVHVWLKLFIGSVMFISQATARISSHTRNKKTWQGY